MNISYFMSVLELYLNKENANKTNLSLTKYHNEKVKVNFTMNHDLNETTNFFIGYETFMEKDNLCTFLNKYKENLIIIDEKYEFDKLNETCYYCIVLSNGRILSFKNFSLTEINNIRNYVYDINYYPDEIKIKIDEPERNGYYNRGLLLGQTGFASYLTFFVIIFALVNVVLITLWIIKNFL